jgi:hypothetical protein
VQVRIETGDTPDTILFLCEQSGRTASPWRKGGYSTVCIDLAVDGQDVRLVDVRELVSTARRHKLRFVGCFAMPPCTHLAGSGARWWAAKGDQALLEALSVSDACIRIAESLRPHGLRWFALENPVGRLSRFLGPPRMTFQPCDFGDPYTKRTCLWGWGFETDLPRTPVAPLDGSRMWRLAPSRDRAMLRSHTPEGFADAFYRANSQR